MAKCPTDLSQLFCQLNEETPPLRVRDLRENGNLFLNVAYEAVLSIK